MAPPVAELLHPNTSGDRSDPGFASALGPQHWAPVDEEDLLAAETTYRAVEDDPVDDETICPGQNFSEEQEMEIRLNWIERWCHLLMQFSDSCDVIRSQGDENAPLPPGPLKVLPETTHWCITRFYCYHHEYMTSDASQTKSVLGFLMPQQMMQVFSLRLSSCKSKPYPISIYGIFAVRDDLEPLRNYVFKRSRDNPVMIHQDSLALPLCSPCRGMYVLDRALLEVDLWVKKEGDGSTDEKLLSVYVEIGIGTGPNFDKIFTGRIHSEDCILDMDYMFLKEGVEAVIQVFTAVESPHHVRFIASSSCFGKEIVIFEGKCVKKGELFTHTIAVMAQEKLSVCLEWEKAHFEWTFQDGALGALSFPDDDSIPFYVRVFFAPKNLERRPPSRYYAWEERCRNNGRKQSGGLLK